jgi:hypothetical protein
MAASFRESRFHPGRLLQGPDPKLGLLIRFPFPFLSEVCQKQYLIFISALTRLLKPFQRLSKYPCWSIIESPHVADGQNDKAKYLKNKATSCYEGPSGNEAEWEEGAVIRKGCVFKKRKGQ